MTNELIYRIPGINLSSWIRKEKNGIWSI